jgi:hypothetical protein
MIEDILYKWRAGNKDEEVLAESGLKVIFRVFISSSFQWLIEFRG